MASATARDERPVQRGKAAGWLAAVFELDPAAINWPRAVLVLDVLLVPLLVLWTSGQEQYLYSALFGVLFAALADPGGSYGHRAWSIAIFAVIGGGLTALGFGIGGDAWGWLVLAASVVTLVAGLAVMFGVHRFVAAYLLNVWFLIALVLGAVFHQDAAHVTSHTWAQVLAWVGGCVLWIAVTFGAWLIQGRHDQPQPFSEIPGDTSRRKMTAPLIVFALLRAIVIAGTFALAFGLNLNHGYWMPFAAIIAMKSSLDQSTVTAAQRVIGALIGAAAAALVLLIPAHEHGAHLTAVTHGLAVVALVMLMHAAAIRFWNYALYNAVIAAAVLIVLDLPSPSNYADEGYRVLWTVCGVAIGVLVMLLAGLLARPTAQSSSQAAVQPA